MDSMNLNQRIELYRQMLPHCHSLGLPRSELLNELGCAIDTRFSQDTSLALIFIHFWWSRLKLHPTAAHGKEMEFAERYESKWL
jgi:hypothetical protein